MADWSPKEELFAHPEHITYTVMFIGTKEWFVTETDFFVSDNRKSYPDWILCADTRFFCKIDFRYVGMWHIRHAYACFKCVCWVDVTLLNHKLHIKQIEITPTRFDCNVSCGQIWYRSSSDLQVR